MNWNRVDRARRSVGPVELDLIESYAQGKVSRRDFLRRGAVVGLSLPFMGALIAACGDDSGSSSTTGGAGGSTSVGGSTSAGASTSAGGGKKGGTIKIAVQKSAGALDPVLMQDLGTYGLIAQCFEFLVTLGDEGMIAPGLAEKWTPNDDGSEWTFQLRKGVKWQDGKDFTSKDVAATMDRLVAAGNSGLKGVIEEGAVDTTDPNVAVFKLASPNGNFPYLVSVFNAQTVITPEAYATETTLDKSPNGTGPWKLDSFDPVSGAKFSRNDTWWGGATLLDKQELQFFEEVGTMVTAVQGSAVDAIVQFQVIGGDALLNSPDFNVLEVEASTHQQIWMRTDKGQFADKKVRQALALCIDRPAMVETLFKGHAKVANDHVFASFYPFFDDSIPQREKNIDMAKQLLSDAGVSSLKADLHFPQILEIPQMADLIRSGAKEAGIDLTLAQESLDTFYSTQWCPPEPKDPACSGAPELGIVNYGHRPVPDVFLNAALATKGIWNSSQYSSKDFDAAFSEYQKAVGVDEQKVAAKKLETVLNEDVPVGIPFFANYLAGHSKKFTGVRVSALGQMFVEKASQA